MPSHETEHSIIMPSGSTLRAPISWESKLSAHHLECVSPEKDIVVYFIEQPILHDLSQMARDAWIRINPHFNLKSSQDVSLPCKDSWEEMRQVVYDTPTSELRHMSATVRIYNGLAYICLVDAKLAGVSRRMAEILLMTESWMPIGFKEVLLNTEKAKLWTSADIQDFEQFASRAMQTLDIPGLSMAIIQKDGQMLYKNAFGVKRMGATDPVSPDTLFMIGSSTKPLTTLAMASLVDRQKFTWETPVNHILPDFRIDSPLLTQQLTIRHSVSASTGICGRDLNFLFKYKQVTPEERLFDMHDMKATTGLGETFQYSNHLVMAGGYAAARAYAPTLNLENAYALMMQELIFNPLQMKRTVLKSADALRLGAALPHGVDFNGKQTEVPLQWEDACYSMAPAGAVWSTVEDMAQYLLVEMNRGCLNGTRIVSEEALMERRKPGINMGPKSSYGLSLMIKNEQGLLMIGHDGGTLGFSSCQFFMPEKGIGVSMLCNAKYAHEFLYAVAQKFLELTFAVLPNSDKKLSAAIQTKEALLKKNQQQVSIPSAKMALLEGLIGDYSSTTLGKLRLLKSTSGEGYEIEFEEWSSRVGIETEADGKPILVVVDGPFPCVCKIFIENDGKQLVIEAMQERYAFIRFPEMQPAHVNESLRIGM